MAKFKVLRRVDAFALYTVEIDAEDEFSAAKMACANDSIIEWQSSGLLTLDAREFVALDPDGLPILSTATGDS